VTSDGLCYTSDVIIFHQNWYHLYSSSPGEKDLSNDTQIRVTGSIEREMCRKTLRNLSDKLGAKFSPITLDYSVVRIFRLDDAFSGILELETSPVEEDQQLQQKDEKRRKSKGGKK